VMVVFLGLGVGLAMRLHHQVRRQLHLGGSDKGLLLESTCTDAKWVTPERPLVDPRRILKSSLP
jgi:hypothetical protein